MQLGKTRALSIDVLVLKQTIEVSSFSKYTVVNGLGRCAWLSNFNPYRCINIGASHVLTDRNPFINKAIHVLLILGFATLFTLVPDRHAKHVLSLQINTINHKNLTTTRIEHIYKKHVQVSKQCK